jgi:hypothetical protein
MARGLIRKSPLDQSGARRVAEALVPLMLAMSIRGRICDGPARRRL